MFTMMPSRRIIGKCMITTSGALRLVTRSTRSFIGMESHPRSISTSSFGDWTVDSDPLLESTSHPVTFSKVSFSSKAAKKKESKSSSSPSYFDRKAAAKTARTAAYQHKLDKAIQQRKRRDNTTHILKPAFRQWFDQRLAREEQLERQSRQQQKEWMIQVSCIVERLPIVLPDKPNWQIDMENLQAYLQQFGKEYPPEFIGHANAETFHYKDVPPTEEELFAMLPENFQPAPRITPADIDGRTDTLDRKLKDRVYLLFSDGTDDESSTPYYFPTSIVQDDESLLDAAKRALQEQIVTTTGGGGGKKKKQKKQGQDQEEGGNKSSSPLPSFPLTLYYPSNMPIAVQLSPSTDNNSEYFGTKTFFMKVQYDEGTLTERDVGKNKSFAWLDRNEIVELMSSTKSTGDGDSETTQDGNNNDDDDDAKFYQYML